MNNEPIKFGKSLSWLKQIIRGIQQKGVEKNQYVSSNLVTMATKEVDRVIVYNQNNIHFSNGFYLRHVHQMCYFHMPSLKTTVKCVSIIKINSIQTQHTKDEMMRLTWKGWTWLQSLLPTHNMEKMGVQLDYMSKKKGLRLWNWDSAGGIK